MLPARISGAKRRGLLSLKKSPLDDDFFSKLAQEADQEEEETSDVSEADPMVLLESMKDTDDMDADLFGSKRKTSSTPASAGPRGPEAENAPADWSSPAGPRGPAPKRGELTFDDEGDDLMEALGFGESPKRPAEVSAGGGQSEAPPPVERRLDEILSRGRSPQPERPASQEKRLPAEQNLATKETEQSLITEDPGAAAEEEDFTFGRYQPTRPSSLERPQARTPPARFSTEDVNGASSVSTGASDWLGLKGEGPGPRRTGEDDWLADALTRKRGRPTERAAAQQRPLQTGQEVGLDSSLSHSKHGSPASRRRPEETPTQPQPCISPSPLEIGHGMAGPAHHSHPVEEVQAEQRLRDSGVETGPLCAQREEAREPVAQATALQRETQVDALQRDRDQTLLHTDIAHRRHSHSYTLTTHSLHTQVELLQEALAEQEAQRQQERDEFQRRLGNMQRDRDTELKRLQEIQRVSLLQMKREHEEQLQRLRRQKDEEINAMTTSTSHSRSVTTVMEQMEHMSRRLGDLSSRIQSSQEHVTQGLEQEAQQRQEQHRVLQEHLTQQERMMREERSRLKEVITKMETQLAEQQRQLEKERWRVAADQARVESAQRALEEERRSLTQRMSLEREELDRAKSALVEEQQAVMLLSEEERRKMAAEWSRFHGQEKIRQERETQEQTDLRRRASEARLREEALSGEGDSARTERGAGARERASERRCAASEDPRSGAGGVQQARLGEVRGRGTGLAGGQARGGGPLRTPARDPRPGGEPASAGAEPAPGADQNNQSSQRGGGTQAGPYPPLALPPAPLLPDFGPWIGSVHLASAIVAPLPRSPGSTEMQARLALIRSTAEKDQDFLQDEQFFLETLKKEPNHSALHTA
ncbi:hypothetical protein AAFF_G00264650 [Aldrovandia affinis]|uniref:Fas-binding factor 1 C-terminal domain-containing protein n=1 Tax=Aldrovandia affinis TaxID=143900 RepID=A0AAD7RBP0_9TELE|nr:hypothetical protein AAFF_G00264650 [Aldrovandia affinis]